MIGGKYLLGGAAVLALCAGGTLAAQEPAKGVPVARATEYQEVTQWPDWTGIWYPDWSKLFSNRGKPMVLTPKAQAKLDAFNEKYKEGGPPLYAQAHCLPPGMPGMMQQPYPIEFLYSPGRVTIITEAYEQVRRVYLGQQLPDDPDLFFKGNSVGHWEGDTLVVDSNGFSLLTTIAPGVEHSEKMTTHEKFYLTGPGEMMEEITIVDPEVLMEPYTTKVAFKLDNSFPIREYICAENNRLESGEDGANIDLKLDGEDDPFANLGQDDSGN
ncbi:hypothetical protein GRI89_12740 [Altererythrobacter salegens]|uniref:Uncharacterized protein n=1 Tax=Croceibacterium salegens TaxID=1737568 RepID=A0A6I4SWA5_9SPHN|nr:hypothetical protein [Croceibacterium salegens]MXO60404.1 hypothetical protein [Croceibacterium salegens]